MQVVEPNDNLFTLLDERTHGKLTFEGLAVNSGHMELGLLGLQDALKLGVTQGWSHVVEHGKLCGNV